MSAAVSKALRPFCLAVLLPISAFGQQVDTTSSLVSGPVAIGTLPELESLETAYRTGNLADARSKVIALLDKAKTETESQKKTQPAGLFEPGAYDRASNVVVVVWAGTDGVGPAVLRRLTVPQPSSHPASMDLPGLRADAPPLLYEVLLAPDSRARLVSQYTFTRENNPIAEQVPLVAERLLGPVFGLLAAVGGPVGKSTRELMPAQHVYATASQVVVPFRRASIKVKSVAQLPMTLEQWSNEVDHFAEGLHFALVSRSIWGKEYTLRLAKAAKGAAGAPECHSASAGPDACLRLMGETFQRAFGECLASCVPGKTAGPDDVEVLNTVDVKFRDFVGVAGAPARIERTLDIKNSPPTHLSLGVGTAVIASGSLNKDRAEVSDSGNLIADPLPRLMTMILLNWSPKGYDADAPSPQPAERWRLFAAAIITPDPGIGIGGSVLVVRGLAVTGGYGFLFTRGLNQGDELGKPPKDPSDALDFARAKVWFAGVSYNFK